MKITFAGTASGETSRERFHSSILLESENHKLLIDAGDGVSKALLKLKIDFNSIDSIIITHFHADHVMGLPSLITQMKLLKRTRPLKIYVHESLITQTKALLNFAYLFTEILDFDLSITGIKTNEEIDVDGKFNFTAKQNSHIWNKHKLKGFDDVSFVSISLLIKTESEQVIYTSDIGDSADLILFNKSTDYFITETTHVSFDEIKTAVEKLNPVKVILTHFSCDDRKKIEEQISSLDRNIRKIFILADDGMTI
ncbi:MAG: MBL fold metallo-hydrolase [Melioribacteraceae bacterium]|nr:MBL fold metallo-hydrolase [Melioribacteraceae bacterium]MCF8355792.1 MBL fold metallo-hydrolase [Melioribacteraceae bacterium]MCF8392818.1 MBL fold metallo-hydrolase [Melioribacteraceae bacterium]MCF8418696.1 MBL fold metallo-hydrolase [Melioribacteraceae bacterium]